MTCYFPASVFSLFVKRVQRCDLFFPDAALCFGCFSWTPVTDDLVVDSSPSMTFSLFYYMFPSPLESTVSEFLSPPARSTRSPPFPYGDLGKVLREGF